MLLYIAFFPFHLLSNSYGWFLFSLRSSAMVCPMVGDWQLMGKSFLEVMDLLPCIKLTLKLWKVLSSEGQIMIQLFCSSYKNFSFCSYAFFFPVLAVVKKQIVNYQGDEVHRLNELEYVYDEVWANIWMVWTCSPQLPLRKDWFSITHRNYFPLKSS